MWWEEEREAGLHSVSSCPFSQVNGGNDDRGVDDRMG